MAKKGRVQRPKKPNARTKVRHKHSSRGPVNGADASLIACTGCSAWRSFVRSDDGVDSP